MKQALWKGYSNLVMRFYKQLKNILNNPEIKNTFPISLKTIKIEYLNFLLLDKPNKFKKFFEKFQKNEANYEESVILAKRKTYLGFSYFDKKNFILHKIDALDNEKIKQIRINFARNKISLEDINLPFNFSRMYQIKSLFTGKNIKVRLFSIIYKAKN